MHDKLLFLGIDGTTRFAIEYAKSLGVYTIVTDYNPPEKAPVKLLADEYWMVDAYDIDALEKKCREEHVTAVFSGLHELCLESTKALTKRLGLPFYASEEGWACARNKALFKEYCREAGLDVPKRYEVKKPITAEILDKISGPVIVKPVDSCASRGISVCHSKDQLEAAYELALQFSDSGNIIVEDYIGGEELISYFYLDEGIVRLTHVNLNVFTQPGGNPTVCGGIALKHRGYTKFIQEELGEKFQKLFSSMNCKHGNIFVQGKIYNGKYYVYEMGYRLAGVYDFKITKPLFGFSSMEALVNLALGRKYSYNGESYLNAAQDCVGLTLLIWANPGKIARITSEELRNMEGVEIICERHKVGEEVLATKNMLQISYYITVIANSPTEMVEKIKTVNSSLQMIDEQGNNMLVPFESYEVLYQPHS